MAVQNPFALQNGSHSAALFRQAAYSPWLFGGTMAPADFAVTAQGTPNMSVAVAAGRAWIPGSQVANVSGGSFSTQAGYFAINDAPVTVTISTANATNPRIDIVYVAVQDAFYSGSNNQTVLGVVTGTPAASPVAPAAPSNALVVAQVAVAANATSITNSNITQTPVTSLLASTLGGIDPVASTTVTAGSYIDQYRGHATKGLQRWNGSAWGSPIPGAHGGSTSALAGSTPATGTQLITQTWTGSLTANGSGDATITFPTAFPNGLLAVSASALGYAGTPATAPSGGYIWHPYAPSLSQVTLRLFGTGSASPAVGGTMSATVTAVGW